MPGKTTIYVIEIEERDERESEEERMNGRKKFEGLMWQNCTNESYQVTYSRSVTIPRVNTKRTI